jgi:hypothetical protein
MSLFTQSEQQLDELRTLDPETLEEPKSRISTPEAVRAIHRKLALDDEAGSYNRSLVQAQKDFHGPHNEKELENKGQSDRFNITTGENATVTNEATAGLVDIFTTPKLLASIPLKREVDQQYAETWSKVMAEEYTDLIRNDGGESLASFNLMCDIYSTHGVAIPYFDDRENPYYSVAGLDHFKFPRNTPIITNKVQLCTARGTYGAADLFNKIGTDPDWNEKAIRLAILQSTEKSGNSDWNDWEKVQQEMKANEVYIDCICPPIEVVHLWVKEFNGKISYYIAAKTALSESHTNWKEDFIYKCEGRYDEMGQFLQIMAFSVGNGGLIYTVRGMGYIIYQLCNAIDILTCKTFDNARVGGSLILQPASMDDAQDMQSIDAGWGIMLPPNMKIPEKPMGQNLNNNVIPALNEARGVMNRATGGMSGGGMMLQDRDSRETTTEVSAKLDFMNKMNSFAINLFYGPLDNITREQVRRIYTVRQKDPTWAKRIKEMKQRCMDRGVPAEMFKLIDFDRVRATRIIGTGSRASRMMIYDQMQQMYSTFDAVGRANFEYDYMCEIVGPEKAERYAGKPNEKRETYDHSIAYVENFQLLEGDFLEPRDGQDHMAHLSIHIPELAGELEQVNQGQLDLMSWTMEHNMLYTHCVATIEMTSVHESVQSELNGYRQQVQQIGELVVNGLKMLNAQSQEEGKQAAGPEGESDEAIAQRKAANEMSIAEAKQGQKLQHIMQEGVLKMQLGKQASEQKQVLSAQEAMGKIAAKDADLQTTQQRKRAGSI